MFSQIKNDQKFALVIMTFLGFAAWWLFIQVTNQTNANHMLDWFAGTYGIIALLGGVCGLGIAKKWGGWNSVIGRSLLMFSVGLLAQEFGQLVYAYYAIVKEVEIPYPSIGDVGFFGSVLLYTYGAMLLAKATGATISLKSLGNKIMALIAPLVLLVVSYLFFLKGYAFDWHQPLTVILDFGYPFGQALYIAIALLAFLLSRKLLGGVMRNKILFIIFALFAQYVADFNFLFQTSRETWTTAGYGDLLYAISYTMMTLAILNLTTKSLSAVKHSKPMSPAGNTA